jgi:uncharacterized Rmd1/YagE family protein
MNICRAYYVAKNFFFENLKTAYFQKYKCSTYRDVLYIDYAPGEIILFPYGVIVAWGLGPELVREVLEEIKPFEEEPLSHILSDEFSFSESDDFSIKNDLIALTSNNIFEKLAISHAIAQSVKLQEFEIKAQQTIEENSHLAQNIAQLGKSLLSRKQLTKKRGSLFLVKSDINLHGDLLDTPEFFWNYPETERFYEVMAKYLDVAARIEILNKKLQVIHELLGMLSDEQNHKHSYRLEWIIILLIAVEIFMFLFHDILGIV